MREARNLSEIHSSSGHPTGPGHPVPSCHHTTTLYLENLPPLLVIEVHLLCRESLALLHNIVFASLHVVCRAVMRRPHRLPREQTHCLDVVLHGR